MAYPACARACRQVEEERPAAGATDRRRRGHADAGYAAIDALVAVGLIAASATLGLAAAEQARSAIGLATELQQVRTLLRDRLETVPLELGNEHGVQAGARWAVSTDVTGAERPIAVCRRSALVETQTARRYLAATLVTCPDPEEGA